MRFHETTSEAQSIVVDTPGHRDHGKMLRDAMPGMANARLWSATYGGYIVFQPGEPWWTEESARRLQRHLPSGGTPNQQRDNRCRRRPVPDALRSGASVPARLAADTGGELR